MANDLGTGNRLAVTALIVGEASGVFAGFCPSWFTVRSPFFHEQDSHSDNVKSIRAGEVVATIIVMGTGAAMWHISGDPVPLVASAIISGIFVFGYEFSMAHPAGNGNSESSTVPIPQNVAGELGGIGGLVEIFAA